MSRLAKFFNRFKTPKSVDAGPYSADVALLHESVNQYLRDQLAIANVTINQLGFLLSQAPMIDAPEANDFNAEARLRSSKSAFAYVHPKTLAPFTWGKAPNRIYTFPGCPTKYVLLSLMPEGRILYSPLQLPGIEKALAG